MASTLVIYNPVAGRMRVRALWPQIEAAMTHAGLDFDAVATRGPLEASDLARAAAGTYARVVGIGGDGTMSEIVNGLMQASGEGETVPLGIVPVGNGDDFAKVLPPQAPIGGACYDWRSAIQKIAAGKTRLYDVGRMRGDVNTDQAHPDEAHADEACRYFMNIVDVGFSAHTVQNFADVPKFLSGFPAYLAAVLMTMVKYPTLRLRIQLDDAPAFEQLTTITAIGNGRCFGGGFWVCPQAEADDGWLDVMVAQQVSRRQILRLLPKLQRGTHVGQPVVSMRRARRIVLESDEAFFVDADGELSIPPTRRLEIDILPSRLRLIV